MLSILVSHLALTFSWFLLRFLADELHFLLDSPYANSLLPQDLYGTSPHQNKVHLTQCDQSIVEISLIVLVVSD